MAIRVLLPVDRAQRPTLPLAAGLASFAGVRLGVVDNGLWRSMPIAVGTITRELAAEGAALGDTTPFNHLAPDFLQQQHDLREFGARQQGVLTGLGN